MEAYLNERFFGEKATGVVRFYSKHKLLILTSKGSSHNHQAYVGGYAEHMTQCFVIAEKLYRGLSMLGRLDFSLKSAYAVLFFHDIEKIWKYTTGLEDSFDKTQWYEHILRDEYGIVFSPEEMNALKYIHGEGGDYTGTERVMNPLATFCHMVDIASARIFFDQKLDYII